MKCRFCDKPYATERERCSGCGITKSADTVVLDTKRPFRRLCKTVDIQKKSESLAPLARSGQDATACTHCGGAFTAACLSCPGCGAPKTVEQVKAEGSRTVGFGNMKELMIAVGVRRTMRKRYEVDIDEDEIEASKFRAVTNLILAVLVCLFYPPLLLLLVPAFVFVDWE